MTFRLLRLATAPAARSAPAAVAQLLVPADSPIFAGHFPGRPLLPGIAHLALLRHVLGELAARAELPGNLAGGTAIAEVLRLRLRRPVLPGDRLELRLLSIDVDGVIRFELRRQMPAGHAEERAQPEERDLPDEPAPPDEPGQRGELASEGTVRIGACGPLPAGALASPFDPPTAAGLPSAAGLLPHASPARLLAAVLAAGASGVLATGLIPAEHPLAAGGEAPGFLAIELAAQAAAALEALARQPRRLGPPARGRPRLGYLVGVRGAHLPATLPTGSVLRVTALPTGSAGALSTYEIEVAVQDAGAGRLATGTISTFLADP